MKETREYATACSPSSLQSQEYHIPVGFEAFIETQSRLSVSDSEITVYGELWLASTETGALTVAQV